MKDCLIGVDVGGTKIEVAILTPHPSGEIEFASNNQLRKYKILGRQRCPTERERGYAHILQNTVNLIIKTCEQVSIDSEQVAAVGFGLPGTIHPQKKTMVQGNTLVLVGRDLSLDVKNALQWSVPFYSENDANCFALAETLCGAGKSYFQTTKKSSHNSLSLGVILGTGCGGGIIYNGKILSGRSGGAGEIGHMVFDPHGPPCYCGRRGCPEQYLSGPGLEAMFNMRKYAQVKDIHTSAEIFNLAAQGEPVASSVIKQYCQNLGRFIGSLNSIFNPDFFVLGGGISQQEMIYTGLAKEALINSFIQDEEIKIYKAQLGDSSGVLGAALLALVE